MSVNRESTLWCDKCGFWERYPYSNANKVRRLAKKDGWKRRVSDENKLQDLCPGCVSHEKEVT